MPTWFLVMLIVVWGAGCIAALWQNYPPGLVAYGVIAALLVTLTVLA